MASVVDLYTELSKIRGLDFGELRHLVRTLQDAELLPKATRRQLRSPPSLDSRDAAIFLIALGTSRTSGARTPSELRWRVDRFKELVTAKSVQGQKSTLFDDLVLLIDRHRDMAWLKSEGRGWTIESLVFVVDDLKPMVVFNVVHRKSVEVQRRTYLAEDEYKRSLDSLDPDRDELCAPAFIFDRGIFFRLADLLGPLEPKEAVG